MFDLERSLREIVHGMRLAADVRDSLADAAMFRGDVEQAARFRSGAEYARAQANEAVRGLANAYRARVSTPEYMDQTAQIHAASRADREAAQERMCESEERIRLRRRQEVERGKQVR